MARTKKTIETSGEPVDESVEEATEEETEVEEAPSPPPKKIRDLGGMYRCKTVIRKDGQKIPCGTELELTNEEARHYIKFEAVEALD